MKKFSVLLMILSALSLFATSVYAQAPFTGDKTIGVMTYVIIGVIIAVAVLVVLSKIKPKR